jgi:PHP family Zn ribbon phosphoesterase
MLKIGDIILCKRCHEPFSLEKNKLAQLYCNKCKWIKDKEYDTNYRKLYPKRKSTVIGRPPKGS